MVAIRRRDSPERLVVFAQCHLVDEVKAILVAMGQQTIHWDDYTITTLLGGRDLRELHLFPQCQHGLP